MTTRAPMFTIDRYLMACIDGISCVGMILMVVLGAAGAMVTLGAYGAVVVLGAVIAVVLGVVAVFAVLAAEQRM